MATLSGSIAAMKALFFCASMKASEAALAVSALAQKTISSHSPSYLYFVGSSFFSLYLMK